MQWPTVAAVLTAVIFNSVLAIAEGFQIMVLVRMTR
jgi:hypothetical protein